MKERPILFSGPMVRAILAGTKTQTRRVAKAFPCLVPALKKRMDCIKDTDGLPSRLDIAPENWDACPYGEAGDRLWVKETFTVDVPGCEVQGGLSYRSDHMDPAGDGPARPMLWKPSIFMARTQSRITLEITNNRIERLKEITEEDCRAEGCAGGNGSIPGYRFSATPLEHYRALWETLNKERGFGWDVNPWVWVIEFKRVV